MINNFFRNIFNRFFIFKPKNKFVSKLVLVNQFFPPDFAATGQLLDELTKWLVNNNPDLKIDILTGYPSYAFTNKKAKRTEYIQKRKIYRSSLSKYIPYKYGGKYVNVILFFLSQIYPLFIKSFSANLIIYTSAPPFLPFLGLLFKILLRKPYLVIIYDIYPNVLVNLGFLKSNSFITKIWKKFNYITYKNASKIIVLSKPMQNILLKDYKICSSNIQIIPSWSNQEKIIPLQKSKNKFIKKHNLINNFVVLYSGNQGKNHDFDTIIDSAELLKDEKYIIFLIIGDGPQNEYIKNKCKKLNLNNCIFLPYQNYEDLPYSLTAADVALVSIKEGSESFIAPSKIYGYMAAGLPIALIAPKNNFLRDMIKENKIGENFKNRDHKQLAKWILELKFNKSLLQDLGKNSRKFLENNANLDLIGKEYQKIIFSCFKN